MVRMKRRKQKRVTPRDRQTEPCNAPAHLALARKKATDDGVSRIERAMTELERQLHSGQLHKTYAMNPKMLSLPNICRIAGVNERFLYGPKHSETTKTEVNRRVANLEKALALQHPGETSSKADELGQLKATIARLRAQLHSSRLLLHEKRAEIRALKASSGPKLVQLSNVKAPLD